MQTCPSDGETLRVESAGVMRQVTEACSSGAEVRLAVGLVAALAGHPHAVRLLLASHSGRLKRTQTLLLKPQNTGALRRAHAANLTPDWLPSIVRSERCVAIQPHVLLSNRDRSLGCVQCSKAIYLPHVMRVRGAALC